MIFVPTTTASTACPLWKMSKITGTFGFPASVDPSLATDEDEDKEDGGPTLVGLETG